MGERLGDPAPVGQPTDAGGIGRRFSQGGVHGGDLHLDVGVDQALDRPAKLLKPGSTGFSSGVYGGSATSGRPTARTRAAPMMDPIRDADRARYCRSKIPNAEAIERAAWSDIEQCLRDPGPALDGARAELARQHKPVESIDARRRAMLAYLAAKDRERGDILSLLYLGG